MLHSLTTPKKRNKSTQNNRGNKPSASSSASSSTSTSSSSTSSSLSSSSAICSTVASTAASSLATNGNGNSNTNTNESNERFDALRDKLDTIRRRHHHQQQQQQQQQQQRNRSITPRESSVKVTTTTTTRKTTTATGTGTTAFCNATAAIAAAASLVNCCRDVNCRFNALPCKPTPLENGFYNCSERRYEYNCYDDSNNFNFTKRRRSASVEKTITKTFSASTASASTSPSASASKDNAIPGLTNLTPLLPAQLVVASSNSILQNRLRATDSNGNNFSFDDTITRTLSSFFIINIDLDLFSWLLFFFAFCTRFYLLATPPHIVFDELHYGKYVSHYMRNMFFFDQHPPLGKQLIAAVAYFAGGYDGNSTFSRIGAAYGPNVPVFWLRFLPALCGSLLSPVVYKLLMQAGLCRWTALLGGLLIIFDNALLTQSRFILMESMLLLFTVLSLYMLLHFQRCQLGSISWLLSGLSAAILLTCATSVKYAGFFTFCLAVYLMCRYLWDLLYDCHVTDLQIFLHTIARIIMFTIVPIAVYLAIFYVHLKTLSNAGPHDSAMTSAFQASLEGGLASITRNQPLKVVHGSQITLRHTHGRTCWLHSHNHVYPVRYPDKRGSSHQQQVTCYSFKDVNNWWIVKRPQRNSLVVGDDPDPIRDGDIIQLVHGITSRGLNSHDVAAPLTPQCQEVSCYIDYNIKMEAEMLWRVDILNKETEGKTWHAIKSQIRLIHTTTGAALRFSGRQLPDWGFNQHEVVADRVIDHRDAIWNVEEHRYTKAHDERERERQLMNAEMLPTKKTKLSFWEKFIELQTKMLWNIQQVQTHMYSSEPIEWPLLDKGIAYWVDSKSNGQIHLLGNILIWYSSTIGLFVYILFGAFYLVRRRRLFYDLDECEWKRFIEMGDLYFVGYLFHYLPYFLTDRTLFLHNYLPALIFKMQLLCFIFDHIDYLARRHGHGFRSIVFCYRLLILIWLGFVVWVFWRFLPLSYGIHKLTAEEVIDLRWKDTWDFILQKDYYVKEVAELTLN